MKKFLIAIAALGSLAANAAHIQYLCVNKKIDERAGYYLAQYTVNLNTSTKTVDFIDRDGSEASQGPCDFKKIASKDPRLDGTYKGYIWSDSGCSVDFYLTKEMVAGKDRAFLKLKQEGECRGAGVWLACYKR